MNIKKRMILTIILLMTMAATAAMAATIGMVADNSTRSVTVFDADTDSILGTVFIDSPSGSIGDCSITPDQTLGFVTDFKFHVWVIDLTTSPPSLAPDPILISNYGEDTAISPDGKFLVVCDGGNVQPIAVVDIATKTEIDTFDLGSDCNSVDVCSDGSVLVTSVDTGFVRRLMIDSAGKLTDTGEALDTGGSGTSFGPNNVHCAPGARSGIVVMRDFLKIQSFTIPGLAPVDIRNLSGTSSGISGIITPAGSRFFARSSGGMVDGFTYSSTTGELGTLPFLTTPISDAPTFYGMDQMAIYPDGSKLYVSEPGALKVYHASTGALLKSITDPNIVEPTGVCFGRVGWEENRMLTGLSPAKVWVGLKNSDDVGIRFDFKAEVFVGDMKAGEGYTRNVSGGGSGFNNALLHTIPLSLLGGPVAVPPGAALSTKISVRRTCSGGGHASGTARLWYNGKPNDSGVKRDAGSRFDATVEGETIDYFLRNGSDLEIAAGSSRLFSDASADSKAACSATGLSRPFKPFGTWSIVLP
jgi:hypothetical protein